MEDAPAVASLASNEAPKEEVLPIGTDESSTYASYSHMSFSLWM